MVVMYDKIIFFLLPYVYMFIVDTTQKICSRSDNLIDVSIIVCTNG